MQWLQNNLGTIVVALVIAGAAGFAVYRLYRNKKAGKSTCGCGCSSCPNGAMCHGKK